jgi:hypothetical protein
MIKGFDLSAMLKNVEDDMIRVFDRSGERANHPDEIGRAKEIFLTKQLERLLPNGVGVGRGYVIDAYGGISNQCDIILYEKNYIPVFVENENTDYAYYPCEGVIAVGEVKTTLTKSEFESSVDKLSKIKQMERILPTDLNITRKVLTSFTSIGAGNSFDKNKNSDNIYTFIFANKVTVAKDTVYKTIRERCVGTNCLNAIFNVEKNEFFHKMKSTQKFNFTPM